MYTQKQVCKWLNTQLKRHIFCVYNKSIRFNATKLNINYYNDELIDYMHGPQKISSQKLWTHFDLLRTYAIFKDYEEKQNT